MFVIDIVTKTIIVNNLSVGEKIPLIPGFLNITYQVNTNFAFSAAFSLSKEAVRIIYCIIAPIGIGVILFFYIKNYKKSTKFVKAFLMVMLVGALGNLVDRIFYTPEYLHYDYNGVVDWIDFAGIWNYVFNWADSCLVVSAFALIIYFIVKEIRIWNQKRKLEPQSEEKILSKDELEKQALYKKEDENKDTDSK